MSVRTAFRSLASNADASPAINGEAIGAGRVGRRVGSGGRFCMCEGMCLGCSTAKLKTYVVNC